MPIKKAWLPREGFTADVLLRAAQKPLSYPAVTFALIFLSISTQFGWRLRCEHLFLFSWVDAIFFFGLARCINNFLSRQELRNWTSAHYDWPREVAVVTGGSAGIGQHISLLLAEKGIQIAILDVQPLTFSPPSNIHHFACDITSASSITRALDQIRARFGSPTILINNAGIAPTGPFLTAPEGTIERIFAVNTLSHFQLARAVLPSMIAANHGTVVTMASLAAAVSIPHMVGYCSSKAAALAFHEGLAAELSTLYDAPAIRTLCVCPSWTDTAMTHGVQNPSRFLVPTLTVQTVAERTVDLILQGRSGVLVLPEMAWWLGWVIRAWPMWAQLRVRNSGKDSARNMGKQN